MWSATTPLSVWLFLTVRGSVCRYIEREGNSRADALANQAMDQQVSSAITLPAGGGHLMVADGARQSVV